LRISATDSATIPLTSSQASLVRPPATSLTGEARLAPARVEDSGGSFTALLAQALRGVNSLQQQADLAAERVATGDAEDLHEAVIALEKADLALRLTAQVTQRAVEAYQEVLHMQL